jgi:putative ABC transport system ATP-binding protein
MLELNNINKTYHVGEVAIHALRGVTLSVRAGEFITIMGPSGSGKSTLLNIMGCMDRPTGGAYRFKGTDVTRLKDRELTRIRNKEIGFVFQNFNLLWDETALQNVMLPLIYNGASDKRARAAEALAEVGLAERMAHRPGELSGGEQQRVAIARALVKKPSIILADEPTGNLDSESGEHIMKAFEQLNRNGMTIVIVTHEPSLAQRVSRLLRFRDGMLVEDSKKPEA